MDEPSKNQRTDIGKERVGLERGEIGKGKEDDWADEGKRGMVDQQHKSLERRQKIVLLHHNSTFERGSERTKGKRGPGTGADWEHKKRVEAIFGRRTSLLLFMLHSRAIVENKSPHRMRGSLGDS